MIISCYVSGVVTCFIFQLRELNEKVKNASEQLSHAAWVAHQQRSNLEQLTLGGRGNEVAHYCLRANLLEQTLFQDAYKCLNYQEVLYSDFLRTLRTRPKFLAACLTAGDKLGLPQMSDVVSILFGGLFGSCVMAEDEKLVLKLLHHLMRSQLTAANNPRKLLRQKNCAFSRLYKVSKYYLGFFKIRISLKITFFPGNRKPPLKCKLFFAGV